MSFPSGCEQVDDKNLYFCISIALHSPRHHGHYSIHVYLITDIKVVVKRVHTRQPTPTPGDVVILWGKI